MELPDLFSICQHKTNTFVKGVTSLAELWEENGKGMYEGSGQSYGNWKGTGNVPNFF